MIARPRYAVSLLAALLLQACGSSAPAEHHGFVARLGRDTVSIENITQRGNHLTVDGVDRFPAVRQRHTEIDLGPDGGIRHLSMDIRTPSDSLPQRDRKVDVDVRSDGVHITKRDATGTLHRDFGPQNAIVVAHVPQMYSLYELYFAAAHKRDTNPRGDDTVHLRQFYIDREFDRFSMHNATVRLRTGGHAEIWHDWLSGIGDATLDSAGRLMSYSGDRTTYKVSVERTTDTANVEAIGQRFAALEASTGGAKQLSVRGALNASIGPATFFIDYGRPLARGRTLVGGVIPYDMVWRTGANAATQFTTSAPITLAGLAMPAGKYTLWTVPRRNGTAQLIVNKETGQWGTEYDRRFDLGTAQLKVDSLPAPQEEFTMSIVPSGDRRGELRMEWGSFRWTAPIVLTQAGGSK